MKSQTLFSHKNKKNVSSRLLKILLRVLRIKAIHLQQAIVSLLFFFFFSFLRENKA